MGFASDSSAGDASDHDELVVHPGEERSGEETGLESEPVEEVAMDDCFDEPVGSADGQFAFIGDTVSDAFTDVEATHADAGPRPAASSVSERPQRTPSPVARSRSLRQVLTDPPPP